MAAQSKSSASRGPDVRDRFRDLYAAIEIMLSSLRLGTSVVSDVAGIGRRSIATCRCVPWVCKQHFHLLNRIGAVGIFIDSRMRL